MSYISNPYYGPYVIKTILNNWTALAGYPTPLPTILTPDQAIAGRIPDDQNNLFFCYQKGPTKSSSFAVLTNATYNAIYTVKVEIRAYTRGLLISYFEHFKKLLDYYRWNPSTKHLIIQKESREDKSQASSHQFKFIFTLSLLSPGETLS